ncbi:MAG: AI-2E family transporter [Elusimicrobiaceae bacterium]|nr:AI-2E family transporter [Elusimicrobiaceae bacterium]MBP3513020.1 AI-2E family transporter [Elusimicrobiaceae bacterium]
MLSDKQFLYYQKTTAICLTIIAAGVVTAFLVYTKALLIPLVISIFFYTILAQMTLYLKHKFSFPSWAAMTVSILLCAAVFTGIVLFTVNSVGDFLKGGEVYRQNLIATVTDLTSRLQQHGIMLDQNFLENYLRELPLFNWLKNFGGKLFSLLSNLTVIMLFMIFFLFGSKKTPPITNPAIKEMLANVSIYLSVKLMASLATGLVAAAILLGFQVKLAVLFALFMFLLNFIPSVGSIVAVLLPVPVLFLQYGFGPKFFIVMGLLTATEFIIGNLLEPRFLGEGMDLHPAAVVASLIFWTLVWGAPGAFLSVPITASVKIVLSKIKHTRPFAEILAGRLPH